MPECCNGMRRGEFEQYKLAAGDGITPDIIKTIKSFFVILGGSDS
jgi:hypothetical protein